MKHSNIKKIERAGCTATGEFGTDAIASPLKVHNDTTDIRIL